MNAQLWRRVAAVGCGWAALGFYCLGIVVLCDPPTIDGGSLPVAVFAAVFVDLSAFAAGIGLAVAAMRLWWGRR